jgi:hypothetical protein
MRLKGIVLALAFLATASAANDAAPEYALLIPRSALVAEIERAEALAFLLAYGAGNDSYAAGFAAGQVYRAKAQLALLDEIVARANTPKDPANN